MAILDSIVVSIPACHAGDRGSIPRRGGITFALQFRMVLNKKILRYQLLNPHSINQYNITNI